MTKLGNLAVYQLPFPRSGVKSYTSEKARGLTLKIFPHKKVWSFRYTRPDGTRNETVIGPAELISETEAVAAIAAMRAHLDRGIDPVQVKAAKRRQQYADTLRAGQAAEGRYRFAACSADFLAHAELTCRPPTVAKYRSSFRAHLNPALGDQDIRFFDTTKYEELILTLAKRSKSASQACHAAARAMLSFAVEKHLITANVLFGQRRLVKSIRPRARQNFMPSATLHAFVNEVATHARLLPAVRCVLHLQLLSGLRVNEITALRWDWIDLRGRIIAIPETQMKANKAVEVVMSDAFRRQLLTWARQVGAKPSESGRVFDESITPHRVIRTLQEANWVTRSTHEIRRTVRTYLQDLGCPYEIRMAITNHSEPPGVAKHYDASKLRAMKLKWLTAWAEALERVREDPKALADNVEDEADPLLDEFEDLL